MSSTHSPIDHVPIYIIMNFDYLKYYYLIFMSTVQNVFDLRQVL